MRQHRAKEVNKWVEMVKGVEVAKVDGDGGDGEGERKAMHV